MKNLLIEPQRVIALAFADSDYIMVKEVTPTVIITAQERFLLPVIGSDLCDALIAGKYVALYDEYVAPALASYIRVEMTPTEERERKLLLGRARVLMRRLSDYVEENKGEFSEYNSSENVLNRVKVNGGAIKVG